MKLPNQYGSITKLSGNRRRPFMIREGETGKQKIIGYGETRTEALEILSAYHKNPWDFEKKSMNLKEVYEQWIKLKSKKLGNANIHSLKSAWKHCRPLENRLYSKIKTYHMQEIIDHCGRSYATQRAIKNLFYHLDRFSLEFDIISKGYAHLLTTDTTPDSKKSIFTEEEVRVLWENLHVPFVDVILIFLYTGFRISELLQMKKSKIDLVLGTFTGGGKTQAGRNRVVPIHPKIFSLVQGKMEEEGDFIFSREGKQFKEQTFRNQWKKTMSLFQWTHTPHECRHTFRSWLDSAGANAVCMDRLMGHKSQGTGDRIYTHKTLEELRKNLELVTN